MAEYAQIEPGVNMRLSQMLSMLNGLLLSTNAAAMSLNTADDFYHSLNENEAAEWSYSNTNYSAPRVIDSSYIIKE